MSEAKITRRVRNVSVTIGTSSSTSSTIRFDDVAGGILHLGEPSSSVTQISVFGATAEDGTFAPVHDVSGAAATITVARQSGTTVETVGTTTVTVNVFTALSNAYPLPDAGFAMRFVRLVADADVGEAATTVVSLKS
jgi:hypothetical protein